MSGRLSYLVSAIAVVATACSLRSTPPMALHGDLSYPRPRNEVCPADGASASLRVQVTDQLNAVLPGVPLYLLPLGSGQVAGGVSPNPIATSTDSTGLATFDGVDDKSSRYTLVAAMAGFVPEVRAIEIRPGCSGELTVLLRVASRERLEALNAGGPVE